MKCCGVPTRDDHLDTVYESIKSHYFSCLVTTHGYLAPNGSLEPFSGSLFKEEKPHPGWKVQKAPFLQVKQIMIKAKIYN